MGIESQYLGEINIPEEHRAEYAQQALKLLRAGGMVTVESVQLYGHKLYLLSPPELDEEDGKAVGHYNYLDENSGERWCLNAKDGWFGCGKIIGSCYYSTVAAVHILTTLWSTSYAATLIDGLIVIGGGITAAAKYIMPSLLESMRGKIHTLDGDELNRVQMKIYNLDDEEEFAAFARGEQRSLKVYGTDKEVIYDPQKRIGVAISKIGASKAISVGAYTFALNQLDK